jgi:hypothetical protein
MVVGGKPTAGSAG